MESLNFVTSHPAKPGFTGPLLLEWELDMKGVISRIALAPMPAWLVLSCFCFVPGLSAQVVSTFTFAGINTEIPDADLSGLVDTRTLTLSESIIQNVTVALSISGSADPAFNGDFYAYLQHDSGLAILLNRVGRRSGDLFGYSDDGFDVTFSDSAANGDIHNYRVTLSGNAQLPLPPGASSLTGQWAPDARNVSPFAAF